MSTTPACTAALPVAGELLPCPFCHHAGTELADNGGDGYGPDSFWLRCNWCSAEGPCAGSEEKAREAWQARAALAPTTPVPAGWKMVPVEPTSEMIDAGHIHTMRADERTPYRARGNAVAAYSAMLAATPAQQTQSDAVAGATENLADKLGAMESLTQERFNAWFDALPWQLRSMWPRLPATPPQQATPTMQDALAAGDGTLHGAIDHWQERALKAEAAASIKPAVQPMTDEDAKKLIEQSDLLDMFEHIGWYSAPKKNFLKNSMTLIRAIEAAHGIRAALKEAPGGGT